MICSASLFHGSALSFFYRITTHDYFYTYVQLVSQPERDNPVYGCKYCASGTLNGRNGFNRFAMLKANG